VLWVRVVLGRLLLTAWILLLFGMCSFMIGTGVVLCVTVGWVRMLLQAGSSLLYGR
jgi:hypothetical protein